MVLRKQTVWLLTMLAVMVVLSGYYLVKGPQDQLSVSQQQTEVDEFPNVIVETKQSEQPAGAVTGTDNQPITVQTPTASTEEQATGTEKQEAAVLADTPNDVFTGYKMNRDTMIEKEKDEQMQVMMNPEATPQAVAEAKARHEELSTIQQATITVEEMLKASGYKDAVVSVLKDKVTVIVQKDKLEAGEVVDIIAQVKQHLNVPGKNISVQYKAL
ncbi:SpoIIIAH-like family protein [Brevibacillus migulae]|uniref:SpoIIIAH-like family protein n=1 Tax=Brevibacillus migulae TaxID=1644114 RepID=UPI00106E6155|nr:SpoIIIAH-like family protein [Brevibacillus migulae]